MNILTTEEFICIFSEKGLAKVMKVAYEVVDDIPEVASPPTVSSSHT